MKQKEKSIHWQITQWLKWQYPGLIFHTDFAAGCKMTIGQAVQNKSLQSGRSWPDLFIPKKTSAYSGLFIEIKRDISEVYKKDLTFKKDDHIEEQAAMLGKLKSEGYAAYFGCGFEHCKKLITEYLIK